MPALQLYLLGPLEIRQDGQPLPRPPTLKSQSLLAYLALNRRRPQPRDRLATLFWGDRPERRARRSLTTALWHIRRCLPPSDQEWLLSDAQTAGFDPQADLWLDVAEFESLAARAELASLQAAVALYRGDFMDGFYDDWVLNERYRLETLFGQALLRLMTGLEAGGDDAGALATGLRLLQHDPLREEAHRLAMRAFCRLGQRNAALEQYRRCQQIVRQELEAEPMAETVELYRAILEGRFQVGPPGEAPAAAPAVVEPALPPGKDPLDPLVRSPLVGRETKLVFLQACWQEARAGHGRLVLVSGEAGVGKSRLVEEFAHQLGWQGGHVLWGRCYEFERLLPYQPIGEALGAILSTVPSDKLTALPGWVLAELARLVPGLVDRLPELAGSAAPLDQEQRRLFDGVARFIASLANDSGLVLILDDLHWATESTLQMIHYLARTLAPQRVLILGTLRPEAVGPDHALVSFQQQLSREDLIRSVNLVGLSLAAVEALLVALSGGGRAAALLAGRLYQETEGNPFFLSELIKAMFETGLVSLEGGAWQGDFARISQGELPLPAGVSEAVQARVGRLDQATRAALQVAAVLGREFDLGLLEAAWQGDEETTLEALEVLLRRRLIGEGSGALGRDYAFQHHKIQEVVYVGIPPRRRGRLHARVGTAMETLYASDLAPVAGELAYHYGRATAFDPTLAPRAIHYLLLAGDQARLAYAQREAIGYYTRALALQKKAGEFEPAGRTLMKLGLAHHISFDFAQARQAFEEGFAWWQQAGRQATPTARPPAPHPLRIRWRCPYTLDPGLSEDYVSSQVIEQLFRGLVSTAPDLDVVPEVARRWQVLDEGRLYRFDLEPEARWSDGRPLTAHDFEYAWKRVLDPVTAVSHSPLLAIKGARAFHQGERADAAQVGARALDDHTLEVELEEPVSHFMYVLTGVDAFPVPRHVVAAHGAAWTEVDHIVSNGPFRLEAWERSQGMRLARNPFYPGRYRGNVEQVELGFPQDQTTQDLTLPLRHYLEGKLDVLTFTDASVHEGDRIRRQFAAEYVSAPWLFTIYLGFVTSRPPFDDVRLRQALALAVDREYLADVTLRGMFSPGTGGLVPPGMPGHSPQIAVPYRPEQAKELLAAAGYPAGSGLSLEGLSVPPIDPLILQYLQAQWQEHLGLQVSWEVADWPPFSRRMQQEPPHLYLLAAFAGWPDPSSFAAAEYIRECTRWADPAHEALVEKARLALDQETRLDLLRQADQTLVQEAAVVPLFYGRQHLLIKPWVARFPISALNGWYWQDAIIEPL